MRVEVRDCLEGSPVGKAERSTWVTSRVQALPANRETTAERHGERKNPIQDALVRMRTHSAPILARLCKHPGSTPQLVSAPKDFWGRDGHHARCVTQASPIRES